MLEDFIKSQIRDSGPMDVGAYMSIVLGHPEHGYYMRKDPFGSGGDFTTAPEISQMFGEILAAWLADVWMKIGAPVEWRLLECGPGRGTLMADILRVFKAIGVAAPAPYLMEMSPVLRAIQEANLSDVNATWVYSADELPEDDGIPMIVIANEFLDALPFAQLQKIGDDWCERIVALDKKGDGLCFNLTPFKGAMPEVVASDGAVFEFSPEREEFVADMRERAVAGLFIDYGHVEAGAGDTFQALYKHEHVGVFEHIGDADLTSHVDFSVFSGVELAEQGAFLKSLGIEARAEVLRPKAPIDVDAALLRLVSDEQMGKLFKVMGFCSDENIRLAGF